MCRLIVVVCGQLRHVFDECDEELHVGNSVNLRNRRLEKRFQRPSKVTYHIDPSPAICWVGIMSDCNNKNHYQYSNNAPNLHSPNALANPCAGRLLASLFEAP